MVRTDQKFPEASSQNIHTTRQSRWAVLRFLLNKKNHFFKTLQDRFCETFAKRVLEERISLHQSRSKAVIARRPGISEESLALAPILIVDDEKNIRLTLSMSLEAMGVETDSAENGEEALAKLNEKEFGLIFLDLHMPGVGGMEVLRQVREVRPDIKVIIITAFGTVELAVEAMKLGAVDFIQKPFVPEEIRKMIARVIDREKLDEKKDIDYASSIELAKKSLTNCHFDAAAEHIRKAIALDPGRAEAFNLLGAVMEIQGDRIEAQKNYRAALSLDPSYKPAISNLQRSTEVPWKRKDPIDLGENILEPNSQKFPPSSMGEGEGKHQQRGGS